ncbi:hypothetical protein CGZ80_15020 [Rhodopirellula sp. MGV]|nr:hypothetical protein CGZ80_15020 [Rhodopirellula sp. MGV]PNY37453.1 hypothetical protein C2E31_08000 [Rhodopirellula baltica]
MGAIPLARLALLTQKATTLLPWPQNPLAALLAAHSLIGTVQLAINRALGNNLGVTDSSSPLTIHLNTDVYSQ